MTPTEIATLRNRWIQVGANDTRRQSELADTLGIDFSLPRSRVWESDKFAYLPVTVEVHDKGIVRREHVTFALGGDVLATLQSHVPSKLFTKASARMRRTPELTSSAHGIMYALLWSLNECDERVVEHASVVLDEMSEEIRRAMAGSDDSGRQLGVNDMRGTIARMSQAEEVLSRVQESQLKIARTARHLRSEVTDIDLATKLDVLLQDIDGVSQHAGFEHNKVRYLQQSIMTTLDVKQNEIVKVFTIITAVFLPPTLIATFYGMNFTNMPELVTQHGFMITTLLTLVAAVIPLVYIKQQGWLR